MIDKNKKFLEPKIQKKNDVKSKIYNMRENYYILLEMAKKFFEDT